jgi:hypothetical protein
VLGCCAAAQRVSPNKDRPHFAVFMALTVPGTVTNSEQLRSDSCWYLTLLRCGPVCKNHVINRGDRREAIFEDDDGWGRLLQTLTPACQKTGWQVHAYCLMCNHFRLVVEGLNGCAGARHA